MVHLLLIAQRGKEHTKIVNIIQEHITWLCRKNIIMFEQLVPIGWDAKQALFLISILLIGNRQLMSMDQATVSPNPEPSEITILALPSDVLGVVATWSLYYTLHNLEDISAPAAVKQCSRTAGNFSVVCKHFAKTVSPLIKSEALMGMLTQKLAQRFDTPLRGALNCLNNQIARQWYEKVGRVRDLATLPEDLRVILDPPNSSRAKNLWWDSHDPQMLKHLVAAGINVNERDPYKVTKIIIAACPGEVENVLLLVNMGANVEAKSNSQLGELTALMYATIGDNPAAAETVALLLKLGADVDARNRSERTALIMAVQPLSPKVETLKTLLTAGADVMAKDACAETALSYAKEALKSEQERFAEFLRSGPLHQELLLNDHPFDPQNVERHREIVNILEQAEIASPTPEERLAREKQEEQPKKIIFQK